MRRPTLRSLALCSASFVLLSATVVRAEEIVTVSGRKGEKQSYLLMHNASTPKAVAVMFPGGEGLLKLRAEAGAAKFMLGSNFLVRTRGMFRDDDIAVAIVDAPSDQQRAGMDDGFRTGQAHVDDIVAVVKDLRSRFSGSKIFLVGTSRGTLSAAYAGRALGDAIDGVTLTSTVFYPGKRGSGLYGFDFGAIKAPLLFVHHVYDACRGCPFGPAESLGRRFALVSVSGGNPAQSDPCGPFAAHGYFGREPETVKAIKNWMLGRPFSKAID